MIQQSTLLDLSERVRLYLRSRVRDAHLADDLTQDVLLKLHLHRAELPNESRRLTAWALRVARNAVIDQYRRNPPSTLTLDQVSPESRPDESNEEPLEAGLARCVRPMVQLLPDAYREAVELADLRQRPQQEVARALGISLSGAKSRVQRGRRQLRAMFSECCGIDIGRRGEVRSVEPTPAARQFCRDLHQKSCVHSTGDPS